MRIWPKIEILISHLDKVAVMVVVALGIILPPLEETNLVPYESVFHISEGESPSIDDMIDLPTTAWNHDRHAPWSHIFSKSTSAWTKVSFLPGRTDLNVDYVATVNLPIHRDIDYFLVEDKKIVSYSAQVGSGRRLQQMVPGAFRFKISKDSQQLFIRSTVAGRTAPRPRIMSLQQFKDEKRRIDFFIGGIVGSALAICFYNLVVGLILSRPIQLGLSLIFLGLAFETTLMSGAAEQIFPGIAHSANLYAAAFYMSLITWISGLAAMNNTIARVMADREVRSKISLRYYLVVLIAGLSPLLFGFKSLYLPAMGILPAVTIIYYSMTKRGLRSSRPHRLLDFALFSVSAVTVISLLVATDVIAPSMIRLLLFEIGAIVSAIPLVTIAELGTREVGLMQKKLISTIMRKGNGKKSDLLVGSVNIAEDEFAPERHQIVTMFIDIAAFSQLAEPLPSQVVFEALSQRLQEITDIVKEFGGSIDRSLGDGLLCFFGYRSEQSAAFNTQRAFLAARKIQDTSISKALAAGAANSDYLIMPVRIGVHSSELVLGNLGGTTRIDFTMIGAGVNFASRLETACTPFKVMFSDVCYQHLLELGYHGGDFSEVAIHIKHKSDLVKAYEFDPFKQRSAELRTAENLYFNQLGIRSADKRYVIRELGSIILKSGESEFTISDVSAFGFRGLSQRQFGRQSRLVVDVQVGDAALLELLREKFVNRLTVEVRWSKQSAKEQGRFEHGFKIVGSSAEQRQILVDALAKRFAVIGPDDIEEATAEVA